MNIISTYPGEAGELNATAIDIARFGPVFLNSGSAGEHQFPMKGTLVPNGSEAHAGLSGVMLRVDPLNVLVGVRCGVMEFDERAEMCVDLAKLAFAPFEDMATTACD